MRSSDPINDFQHRVTLLRPIRAADPAGSGEKIVTGYATVVTRWAKVANRGGDETLAAGQVQARSALDITIRHGSDLDAIDSSWIVLFGRRVFEIKSAVLRDEMKLGFIDIVCTERPDGDSIRIGSAITP